MKVLLSIRPKYVKKIQEGMKRFEFRKQLFKNKPDSIIVYETMPVGKVVGEIFFESILRASPQKIWEATHKYAGVSESCFRAYFASKSVAYAIKIERYEAFEEPLSIECYGAKMGVEIKKAPQSFCYIKKDES